MQVFCYLNLGLVFVFVGWFSAYYNRSKLLFSILSLEIVTLGFFLFLANFLSMMSLPVAISFYILVLGACEITLGLSLLVYMTSSKGGDMFKFIDLLSC